MYNERVTVTRIQRFKDELAGLIYPQTSRLSAHFIYDQFSTIPYCEELEDKTIDLIKANGIEYRFKEIKIGEEWGKTWGSGWFRFTGVIPQSWQDMEVGVLIDTESEACIFKSGTPWQGLTNKIHWSPTSAKRLAIITQKAKAGSEIMVLVEAAANGLFGEGQEFYRFKQAELCLIDRKVWKLYHDLETISSMINGLEEKSVRRRRLIYHTNEAINVFGNKKGIDKSLQITGELLAFPANASSTEAYSVGHAHIDLAWLWRMQETRRKAGRTFSTALRLMEEYPDYIFGASQPQLYQWVKEDYPALYNEIKERVCEGRWECQGAMWVEPDMNITGGESLVRQCLYGKKFWQEEFDLDIKNLWLPDVFGYSAALPQILRKSGVDYFMTQKISWNETNIFPHHTFYWEGIDGSRIATHFLPTNDYNCANLPHQLIESEKRFAQADVTQHFLNLYGIGDGGGGPGRIHIELGKRQYNSEGCVKVRFKQARQFFKKLGSLPPEVLPVWKGELYLELHRGTYTTQARMKKYNRQLEIALRDLEFLASITGEPDKELLDNVWQNTLLCQFHDILPGSSIKEVYQDAHTIAEQNLLLLEAEKQRQLDILSAGAAKNATQWQYLVYNTLSWRRQQVISLELPDDQGNWQITDSSGNILSAAINQDIAQVKVDVPPCGYISLMLSKIDMAVINKRKILVNEHKLENELIRVEFDDQGIITSIIDKELQREMLAGNSNHLLLYEDKPNDWGAWDINHYYRETEPEQAKLVNVNVHKNDHLWGGLWLDFTIGNSQISQLISLKADSKLIECWTHVKWNEKNKMLKVRMQPDIVSDQASFEIQYGYITRPTHSNTSWEAAKFETCAHRFADLSQRECGFALINDCKYGHYIKDNVMELTLLRSPQYPDKTADLGEHSFRYACLPHANSLRNSEVIKTSHEFNDELILQKVENLPRIKEKSYFDILGSNVKLETVKPAENGDGLILRLYEFNGSETEITLQTPQKWEKLIETDLMENDLHLDCKKANQTKLDFKPFEIRTFRLIY